MYGIINLSPWNKFYISLIHFISNFVKSNKDYIQLRAWYFDLMFITKWVIYLSVCHWNRQRQRESDWPPPSVVVPKLLTVQWGNSNKTDIKNYAKHYEFSTPVVIRLAFPQLCRNVDNKAEAVERRSGGGGDSGLTFEVAIYGHCITTHHA